MRRKLWRLILAISGATVVTLMYYFSYYPNLTQLQQQAADNAQALLPFQQLQQRVDAAEQLRQQTQLQQQLNLQQVASLSYFLQLISLTPEHVTLDSIRWLPGELQVTGSFQHTQAVKKLQRNIPYFHPSLSAQVRFSAPHKFLFQLIKSDS